MRGRLKLVLLAGFAAGGCASLPAGLAPTSAEHACRAVLDPPADGSDPWFRLGNALAEAGDYDAAERAYRESLRRRPDPRTRHNLALVQLQLGLTGLQAAAAALPADDPARVASRAYLHELRQTLP
ncbi:MAG TPA: tetratricopeptide repeat protein [Plasticicumulans sp.]|nr:tetratricopeptide repeat protein [Plasticicumulans sp.]